MQRDKSIDMLRFLGIFLVVLGHLGKNTTVVSCVYGFHMPLFFFLSGYFFSEKKYSSLGELLKRKFSTLIIPYAIFFIVLYFYWLLVEKQFRTMDFDWWIPLTGIIYGTPYKGTMYSAGAIWFLPCLFTVEVLYWCLFKLVRNKYIICIFAVISFILASNLKSWSLDWLPFALPQAMIALWYYSVAVNLQGINKFHVKKTYSFLLAIVFILSYAWLFPFVSIDIYTLSIGAYWAALIVPIVMIMGLYFLFASIKSVDFLTYIGMNCIIIIPFHQPLYRAILFVFNKITHIEVALIRESPFASIGLSLFVVFSFYMVMPLWNKLYTRIVRL